MLREHWSSPNPAQIDDRNPPFSSIRRQIGYGTHDYDLNAINSNFSNHSNWDNSSKIGNGTLHNSAVMQRITELEDSVIEAEGYSIALKEALMAVEAHAATARKEAHSLTDKIMQPSISDPGSSSRIKSRKSTVDIDRLRQQLLNVRGRVQPLPPPPPLPPARSNPHQAVREWRHRAHVCRRAFSCWMQAVDQARRSPACVRSPSPAQSQRLYPSVRWQGGAPPPPRSPAPR